MPRKSAKASGQDASSTGPSDEEIMQERQRAGAFEKADSFLQLASWGLWIIGGLWFFSFSTAAPAVFSAHVIGEPSVGLICAGILCSSLAKASPKGTWSSWRIMWHLAWGIAFGAMTAGFTLFLIGGRSVAGGPTSLFCLVMVAACGCLCAGALLTVPGGTNNPGKGSSSWLGRMMIMADGALGALICGRVLLGAGSLLAEPLGLIAMLVSTLPLGMCSIACVLCTTDAELVSALPPVVLVHTAGFLGHLFSHGLLVALPSGVAIVLHCYLFLPVPLHDPDSNPFHVWIRGYFRSFAKLMTEPVSGFGDEND